MNDKKIQYVRVYEIIKHLIEEKCLSANIYDLFIKLFKIDFAYINEIKGNVSKVLECNDYITLKSEYVITYETIPYFLAHFYYLRDLKTEELLFQLEQYIGKIKSEEDIKEHFIYLCALTYVIDCRETNYDEDYYVAMFLYNYLSCDKIISMCSKKITAFEFLKNESISILINNQALVKTFTMNNVENFEQLFNSPFGFKIVAFIYNNIDANYYFNYFNQDKFGEFIDGFSDMLLSITPKEERVLCLRYGINDGKMRTFDEIGQIFSLTRERVRQIVAKGEKNLLNPNRLLKVKFLYELYYNLFKQNENGMDLEILNQYISPVQVNMFRSSLEILEIAKYNARYNILIDYNSSFDEVIGKIIDELDELIPSTDLPNYNSLQQMIINKHYKNYTNVYVKTTLNKYKVILKILSEKFNGVFNSRGSDLNQINKILMNDYFFENEMDIHSFLSLINRHDYYPIGKGLYKNANDFPVICDELVEEIIDYLNSMDNAVLYSNVFEKFKTQLLEIGIDTSAYFKSVIDLIIKDDFKPTKDYIYKNESSVNVIDYLVSTLKSFNGPFDFLDVKGKLPQYSEISLKLTIDREIRNDLIQYDTKKYIYLKDFNVEEDTKEHLLELIKNHLNQNNGVASVNNIFVDLYYNHEELLNKLGIVGNPYGLFSLLKCLFRNKYSFNRPFVFENGIEKMSIFIFLNNKINSYNEITFADIRNILTNHSIGFGYSRYDFIDGVCENFILKDANSFINKRAFLLSNSIIQDIKLILNLYLKKEKELDTAKFTLYNIFPKLKYKWNKYLLIGIIKTYANSEYEVIYKNENRNFDYIVRRLINE